MDPVQSIQNSMMKPAAGKMSARPGFEAQQAFAGWLNQAVQDVNDKQIASTAATEKMARGENIDLHDVMIASQKASVALQTTVEVRNKAIEAYQEIMRMQV
ncbi:flagellar hook-basal body complex protein FliE [Bacillus sp. H-16]|uniref:flagellar hook-basal body complex protein FliE n=1 Tax=Alteribacter salitolerans TaxID=2912333 RepID=UPI001963C3A1|nr:flagellar hook-basal body complex protein FliE [Alteribacter salitolerans]MBM7094169.1 flagellar hook-basal body complex protein FliE [Alteribacter salitolerans]